jgi:succinate dehydrogenase / fumarate reductase, cytochrome b subunit
LRKSSVKKNECAASCNLAPISGWFLFVFLGGNLYNAARLAGCVTFGGVVSIMHRLSGIFLFAGIAVLMWMLDLSLSSEEGFVAAGSFASSLLCKIILWAVLAGLAYHMVAGIRHLVMDFGVGETLKGGQLGAKLVLVIAIVLIILAGVWVW